MERKDFVQKQTQLSGRLDAYHIGGHQCPPQGRARQLTGSWWIAKLVRSSLSQSRRCETGQHRLLRSRRIIDWALWTNSPVTCGQSMLIDARMRWDFGPVFKSQTSSPSHVRGLNRSVEAVVRTQLTGPKQQTHTIARLSFFAQKFRPAANRHHSGGWRGLAAPEIASPSDGLSKLTNYCCSADGTRPD